MNPISNTTFFGFGLPVLRIAGGILAFLIGYQILHGESSKMHSAPGSWSEIGITLVSVAMLCLITKFCFVLGITAKVYGCKWHLVDRGAHRTSILIMYRYVVRFSVLCVEVFG